MLECDYLKLRARFNVRGGSRWSISSGICNLIFYESWFLNNGCIDDNIIGAYFVCGFTVGSLMHTNSKSWNGNLVKHVFSEDIATSIINTPLFNQIANKKLVWKAKKKWFVLCSKSVHVMC